MTPVLNITSRYWLCGVPWNAKFEKGWKPYPKIGRSEIRPSVWEKMPHLPFEKSPERSAPSRRTITPSKIRSIPRRVWRSKRTKTTKPRNAALKERSNFLGLSNEKAKTAKIKSTSAALDSDPTANNAVMKSKSNFTAEVRTLNKDRHNKKTRYEAAEFGKP